jgi:hypothetical protein
METNGERRDNKERTDRTMMLSDFLSWVVDPGGR